MIDRIDGGPAFPIPYHPDQNWQNPEGMTLRDWFAGMALQGILTNGIFDFFGAALDAYDFADAMLKAREAGE